jgi:TRAP-type C4-dicarboxylate transport system permease small subunit
MASQISTAEMRTERTVETLAKWLNIFSAAWLFSVALLILYDVIGRELFSAPFHGTNEIVSNSVLSILFLQLPLSILKRNSLRTTIVFDMAGTRGKGYIDALSYFLAGLLFVGIAIGGWPNMIEAWQILEQEGSGIIVIPVYPIRSLVVFVSIIAVGVCCLLIYQSVTRPEDYILDDTESIDE